MINAANLQKPFRTHKRVAGTMPFDSNIEFIGIPSTQEVIWFQYGNQHSFNTVPKIVLKQLQTKFFSDSPAVRDLAKIDATLERKIEIYTYFCFGDADFTPDVIDGILQPSENFRHSVDCISLKWKTKDITIGKTVLNSRDIKITDLIWNGYPDKYIANVLNITMSTYDYHRRNLYRKAGVTNKADFINKVTEERIN
ncbi:helix-turn-helix transcriptional regulator [Polaribacter ponticola]|uniref:LuxR C-terminal-related transcriptional regulator n=1 Tax=Polaribacter ponticola TaxID=2978475 RepID=A0ABT5S6J8_9FLAO|nr:LuxR C-terminal-related transcriptional regulator [Polaribacter sp. MSW5]MDD7912962.1 LuxR C-terminal-related transcriptional regulator [Polaribacter sp. MSW5]MDD7913740.1 LuxR C-terminal-related transcriptional regulator [Polaribacter sp. MSW5]